jgi:hypothetical protein
MFKQQELSSLGQQDIKQVAELLIKGATPEELIKMGIPEQLIEEAIKLLQQAQEAEQRDQQFKQANEGLSSMATV